MYFSIILLVFSVLSFQFLNTVANTPGTDYEVSSFDDTSFLSGSKLRVATSFSASKTIFTTQLRNGTSANIYGTSNVAFAYILDFMELFNFTIEIIESRGWMEPGSNGTIKGIGHQIETGEADIGIDLSKSVIYRMKRIRFLHPVKEDRVAIMFRQPQTNTYKNILFSVFRPHLWISMLIAWLLLLTVAAVVTKKGIQMWKSFHVGESELSLWNHQDDDCGVFIPVTAALLARATEVNILNQAPLKTSLRLLLLVSSLFGFTMFSVYSAFIVSSLRKADNKPIKKFTDLIEFKYKLMAEKSLPDFTSVYVSDRSVGGYYAGVARKNFVSVENAIGRVFSEQPIHGEGVGWFVLKADFYYHALTYGYSTREICQVATLEPQMESEHPRCLSMYVSKENKTLKEAFNRRILHILERGIGSRHILSFERKFQPKCDPTSSKSIEGQGVRFLDVYLAYYALLCGAGVALSILGWERIFHIRNNRDCPS